MVASDKSHLDELRDLLEALAAGDQRSVEVFGSSCDHSIQQLELAVGVLFFFAMVKRR